MHIKIYLVGTVYLIYVYLLSMPFHTKTHNRKGLTTNAITNSSTRKCRDCIKERLGCRHVMMYLCSHARIPIWALFLLMQSLFLYLSPVMCISYNIPTRWMQSIVGKREHISLIIIYLPNKYICRLCQSLFTLLLILYNSTFIKGVARLQCCLSSLPATNTTYMYHHTKFHL